MKALTAAVLLYTEFSSVEDYLNYLMQLHTDLLESGSSATAQDYLEMHRIVELLSQQEDRKS